VTASGPLTVTASRISGARERVFTVVGEVHGMEMGIPPGSPGAEKSRRIHRFHGSLERKSRKKERCKNE